MKTMKKTVLATALLTSMGIGVEAEAVILNFNTDSTFTMYDGSDTDNWAGSSNTYPTANFGPPPTYTYDGTLNSGDFAQSLLFVDVGNQSPISGYFDLDFGAGTGTGALQSDSLSGGSFTGTPTAFYGSPWTASIVSMTRGYVEAGYTPINAATNWHTIMKFNWGDPAATPCLVTNCDINVAVDFDIQDTGGGNYSFTTVGSWMFDGPFIANQATFGGTAVAAVPVPATAWVVGSGLLGLIGVGRMRKKNPLPA